MSVDLYSFHGMHVKLGTVHWMKILQGAEQYGGWTPAGTVAPAGMGTGGGYPLWDGNYTSNDGQVVTEEDAAALAAALERALNHISQSPGATLPADPIPGGHVRYEPGIKTLTAFAGSSPSD